MVLIPMKCKVGSEADLQRSWIFEPKLDGIRALCYVKKNSLTFFSRAGNNLTTQYPELSFRDCIHATTAILDGEIVSYTEMGIPDFQELKQGHHAYYVVFDLLQLNGRRITQLPLRERKRILDHIIMCQTHGLQKIGGTDDGPRLWNIMKKKGMEGVVAKDPSSHYYPGVRSPEWIKIKFSQTLDVIIIGFTKHTRILSSLAASLYDGHGNLHYLGKIGTGYNSEDIIELEKLLSPLTTAVIPKLITHGTIARDLIWVKPKIVCEVRYLQFTQFGILRGASFQRIRYELKARNCTFHDQGLPTP